MLQRTVLRQSRAVQLLSRSARSSCPISTRPSAVQRWTQPARQSSFRPLPRFYSTESQANSEAKKEEQKKDEANKGAQKEVNEAKEGAESGAQTESVEEQLKKQLEAKNKEILDLKDRYLRSVADFHNLQERTKREMVAARNFAIQRFATDLLESIDNFERALATVPKEKVTPDHAELNSELRDLYEGLKMTETVLMSTLKKHGLERYDPGQPGEDGKPQKFDPQLHEATFMAQAADKEDGDIMHVQCKGFILNGRVLRAAKVGVVKNSS
ncbi:hypothetical protein VTN31DRAFT_1507 [Thermomyces dupontii]|uniref:uncharacterized protein n=1 Tax=Talaromyces thermophilus TaxID=28565 RepID=UPI0037439A33